MQTNQNSVIWTVVVATIILLVVGIIGFTSMPSKDSVNDQIQIAIDGLDIPTAEEIAALIQVPEIPEADVQEMPDTFYSVNDEKKALAEDLATEELDEKDVKRLIADELNYCLDVDVDYKDITKISVKDVEVKVWGKTAIVTLELKVYFDNYGDDEESESARIDLEFTVNDLVRDDDYEDAEVDGLPILESVYSCSTD